MKATQFTGILVSFIFLISGVNSTAQTASYDAVKISQAERFVSAFFSTDEVSKEIIEQAGLQEKLTPTQLPFVEIRINGAVQKNRRKLFNLYLEGKMDDKSVHSFRDEVKNRIINKINDDLAKGEEGEIFHLGEREEEHDHGMLRVPGGPCDNPDFESCNFNNWNLTLGSVPYPSPAPYSFTNNGPAPSWSTTSTATPVINGGSSYDQHYIVNGGTDPIGGFPMVYPGGSCSAAIGDFTNINNGAAQISQVFMVSSNDAILVLNYAVVLQDAGHAANEQPYFRMRVYDQAGNSITCASYEAVAGDGQPGWTTYPGGQYKPWTTVFIPLAPYLGQNVTVEFTIGDCAQGGHYGYAYVDASCTAMALNMSASSVCAGQPITITAPPGAASYLWSPGGQTTQTISVSTGGNYQVTVTPVTGSACAITLDTTVQANPNPLAAFTSNAPVCAGTPVNFTDQSTVNGGSAITQWSWNFGDGQTSTQQNPVHTYATAGSYTVTLTVTNAAGCTNTITQNITINNNAVPVITPAGPFCSYDAPVTLTASVGGGTWSATCGSCINATTGQFDPGAANFGGGGNTITYTITGACAGSDTEVIIVENIAITNVASTNVDCFGNCNGTIAVTATGASQYNINGGAFQASPNFSALCANTYNIIAQSPIGCQATAVANITEPPLLTLPTSNVNETCFGSCDGIAIVAPQGGTTPYSYSWSNGGGNSPTINNLCVGTYTVTVTDGNSCMASANINIAGPPPVAITNIVTTNEFCQNDCTGSITITAPGVTQYSIDGGTTFQPGNAFANICSGNYNIVVQDASGCQATGNAIITSPNPISLSVSNDTTICIGGTATISASASGGTGALVYVWDNGLPNAPSHNVSPATQTTYTVYVQDANGCSTPPQDITVSINPPLVVVAQSDQAICPGQSATITASASGGNGGPYTYTWSDGVNTLNGATQTVSPSATTTYTVTASDNCGTPVATDAVTITVNIIPTVTFTADDLDGCTPVSVNFTNTTAPGETGTCFWDFGNGTTSTNCDPNMVFTAPGCYDITLTVTSPQGCVGSLTVLQMICVYPYPVAEFTFGPQPTDILMTTIDFTNQSQGGIIYDWDFAGLGTSNAVNPSFTFPNDNPGTYPVCLYTENQYGCADSICHDVIINDNFVLFVPNAFTVDNDGLNDVFLPIIDGIDPYSYTLYIFNRWGDLIFETHNPQQHWDGYFRGVMSKQDVYVWKILAKEAASGKKREFYGHVSLLR